jgi:hypothetical protein
MSKGGTSGSNTAGLTTNTLTGPVADIAETALMTHLGHRLPLLAAMHRPDLL